MADNPEVVIEVRRAISNGPSPTQASAEAAASIGRALTEVARNKLVFPDVSDATPELDALIRALNQHPTAAASGIVARDDVACLRDQLAAVAWTQPEPWAGEVSIADLHLETCEWGDAPEDASTRISYLEFAIDALDFVGILLGPEDRLAWEVRS